MSSPTHHTGLVKWYNIKAGYGFIHDQQTGDDVFVHAAGLTRSLKENPPREGEELLLNIRESNKGPEARNVARTLEPSLPPQRAPPKTYEGRCRMMTKITLTA
ncbi:Cold shock-like protein CspE [Portunus trituberculatus]|uniref:Cold shock-like protein CspE n=1 Tax=Portunus trituberculatus TaxID=210409 RepID=A0A5B7JIQ1_PORTR|nr:Cold shock-like protein CspE [Portunus trituberculatus]